MASFHLLVRWPGFCWLIWWFSSVVSVHLIWTDMADSKWWPSDPWNCQRDPHDSIIIGDPPDGSDLIRQLLSITTSVPVSARHLENLKLCRDFILQSETGSKIRCCWNHVLCCQVLVLLLRREQHVCFCMQKEFFVRFFSLNHASCLYSAKMKT